jgi:hypothetical protein
MPRKSAVKRIEVNIEGFSEDGGDVRLDALFNFLAEIKRTLAAVEREVTASERSVLAYKVVAVSYASPMRFIFESITPKSNPNLGNVVATRWDRDLRQIEQGLPMPKRRGAKTIEPATLEQFEKLATHRKQVSTIRVGLENDTRPITSEFDEKLRKLLGNIYKSRGTFRGRLEAVNIHSTPCVLHIYPVVGPARVRCTYPKGRFPQIGEHLGKTVDVSGIVKYRGDEPHPYEIEVEGITPLKPKSGEPIANTLVGCAPGLTDGKDIMSYLREIRHD